MIMPAWLMFALAASSTTSSLALVEQVTSPAGCAPRLLGQDAHRFIEAQIACDVFLALALVDESLAGQLDTRSAATAVRRLLVDAQGRGALPFAKSPHSVLRRGYDLLLSAALARLDALSATEGAAFDLLANEVAHDIELAAPAFVESFHGAYWPCDSAPAAAGLLLHGALRHDVRTASAGARIAQRLETLRTAPGGFITRVDRAGSVIEATPRGTVMAWTAGFLSLAAPAVARAFADDFYSRFCATDVRILGVTAPAACREWPRGIERAPDAVSGPIIDGQGTGASALGIAALRATGRVSDANKLTELSRLGQQLVMIGAPMKIGPLENAILAWGATARPWLPVAAADEVKTPSDRELRARPHDSTQ